MQEKHICDSWRCQDSYCALTSAVFAFMHAIICHTVLIKCRFMFLSVLQCHTVYIVITAHMHLFMHLFNKRTALKYGSEPELSVVNEAVEALKTSDTLPCSRWDPYYWPPWNIHLSSTRPSSNEIWRVSHETGQEHVHIALCITIIKVKLKIWHNVNACLHNIPYKSYNDMFHHPICSSPGLHLLSQRLNVKFWKWNEYLKE